MPGVFDIDQRRGKPEIVARHVKEEDGPVGEGVLVGDEVDDVSGVAGVAVDARPRGGDPVPMRIDILQDESFGYRLVSMLHLVQIIDGRKKSLSSPI